MGDESKAPEFEPPQACVTRIVRGALSESVQVSKDAKAAFSRAAGIYILYLTHCANDFCKEAKRSTIYAQDVTNALEELDFSEFIGPLNEFLDNYKSGQDKKKKEKVKAKQADGDDQDDGAGNEAAATTGGAESVAAPAAEADGAPAAEAAPATDAAPEKPAAAATEAPAPAEATS